MPHINIKCFPTDISPEEKKVLIDEMTATMVKVFDCPDKVVSIVLEQIEPEKWQDTVVDGEINAKSDKVIKQPIY